MVADSLIVGAAIGLSCGLSVGWLLWKRSGTIRQFPLRRTEIMSEGFADNPSGECKLVLIVRTDLKMGKGKTAAQCCHAAVMAYQQLNDKYPDLLEAWRGQGQAKVVLRTDSEQALLELASNAKNAGLVTSLVRDAGRTQVAPGSRTVLGVGPGPKELVDQVTGHLKLF